MRHFYIDKYISLEALKEILNKRFDTIYTEEFEKYLEYYKEKLSERDYKEIKSYIYRLENTK